MKPTKAKLYIFFTAIFIACFYNFSLAQKKPVELKIGSVVEKEIAPEETHTFKINLKKEQFCIVMLIQNGIDVSISSFTPDGEELGEFDSPNGAYGPEPITLISETAGDYRLEVTPLEWNKSPGLYSIKIVKLEDKATTREGKADQLLSIWDNPESPGVAVAVVKEGKIIFSKGYGSANLEYNIPITPSTVFHIASVSKQFTAFAVAMLAQEGKLSLDDDIQTHISEVPDFGETITLRHLVHHTSGMRDQWNLLVMAGWRMDDVITKEQILKLISNQKDLNFSPGEEFLYCNTGFTLLAEVVARKTGKSFAEWTKENIFEPLGMDNTLFYDDHEKLVSNRAYSYHQSSNGFKKSVLNYANVGATSLFTTVEDLCKWAVNFEEIKLGNQELMEQMKQQGILNNGDTISYALGQGIGNYKGLNMISHGGGDAGYRTFLARFPDQKISVVVFSNMASFNAGGTAINIADIYLEEFFPEEDISETEESAETDVEEFKVDNNILEEYCGQFELQPGLVITITLDKGQLIGQATGQQDVLLSPRSQTEFFIEIANATIIFNRNEDGEVNNLTLLQAGQEIVAPRIPPFDPESVVLEEFTGEYYSEELSTSYNLVIKDSLLIAKHQRHTDIILTPTKEDFFTGSSFALGQIEFIRNETTNIIGCKVSNGRVRNLLFKKNNKIQGPY